LCAPLPGKRISVEGKPPLTSGARNCDHRISEPHEDGCSAADEATQYDDGMQANDVFIVEGQQKCYGGQERVRGGAPLTLAAGSHESCPVRLHSA